MSTIHQLYCTPGTAPNGRGRENASGVMIAGIRAGSIESRDLEPFYQQFERHVYYDLPVGTTDEQRRQLTAATAPRRLFYLSLPNGLQILGQACYRGGDANGKSESSFAHIIFHEAKEDQKPWSVLDALKLWGASGWLHDDAAEGAAKPAPLGSLAEMLGRQSSAIGRHAFLSFLCTPADGPFEDPGDVIPARWRSMDANRRRDWFLDLFSTFLKSGAEAKKPQQEEAENPQQEAREDKVSEENEPEDNDSEDEASEDAETENKESEDKASEDNKPEDNEPHRQGLLRMVMEPSLAALMYYGILRLLPPSSIRDGASFSTYEPDLSRADATLAATWFSDPQASAAQAETLAATGVINTLQEPGPEIQRPRSQYAAAMLQRLLEKGWEEVDWQLETLSSVKAQRAEHFEALAGADRLVKHLLETGSFANQTWRKSPAATSFLRKVLCRRVAKSKDPAALLKPIAEGAAQLTVLDLLASHAKDAGVQAGIDFLLSRLPPDKIAGLLKLHSVPASTKLHVLAAYVQKLGTLPPECDILWETWSRGAKAEKPAKMGLLPHLLTKLPPETLAKFFEHASTAEARQAFLGLLQLRKLKAIKGASITPVVQAFDQDLLVAILRGQGQKVLEDYPGDEPGMPRQLAVIARSLADRPREVKERLDLVLAGQHLLEDADQRVATAWANFRKHLLNVGRLQDDSGLQSRSSLLAASARDMALAVDEAVSYAKFEGQDAAERKLTCVEDVAREFLGKQLLPPGTPENDALWKKIETQLQTHKWPSEPTVKKDPGPDPLGRPGSKKEEAGKGPVRPARKLNVSAGWLGIVVIVLMVLLTVAVGFGGYWLIYHAKSGKSDKSKGKKRPKKEQAMFDRPGGFDPYPARLVATDRSSAESGQIRFSFFARTEN